MFAYFLAEEYYVPSGPCTCTDNAHTHTYVLSHMYGVFLRNMQTVRHKSSQTANIIVVCLICFLLYNYLCLHGGGTCTHRLVLQH